jgi:hypothetical protein
VHRATTVLGRADAVEPNLPTVFASAPHGTKCW